MAGGLDGGHSMDVLATGLGFVEGPVWHDDRVWYVVADDGVVAWLDPAGGHPTLAFEPGGGPNGLTVGADGAFYLANNGGAVHGTGGVGPAVQRLAGGGVETLATVAVGPDGAEVPLRACNDLCFGPDGALWFTDPANPPVPPLTHPGLVCRLPLGADRAEVVATGLEYPNGIAFDPDGARLFVAESFTGRVLVFAWSPGGGPLGEPEVFCSTDHGVPDGICLDADGRLYAACTFGANIQVFDPDGQPVEKLDLGKGSFPTNCCFGGPGFSTLYVTDSAVLERPPHDERHRQRIVSFDVGTKGLPLLTGG